MDLSILIPTYNRASMIGDCISSALRQVPEAREIVVVDNNSNDGTWDIVCSYKDANPGKLKVFRNNRNIGPVANWIKALDMAKGAYVTFLFSDDLLLPGYTSKAENLLHKGRIILPTVFIGTSEFRSIKFYPIPKLSDRNNWSAPEYQNKLLRFNEFSYSPCGVIFPRDLVLGSLVLGDRHPIPFDYSHNGAGADLLLLLNSSSRAERILYSEAAVFFRSHPGSFTVGPHKKLVARGYSVAKINYAYKNADPVLTARLLFACRIFDFDFHRSVVALVGSRTRLSVSILAVVFFLFDFGRSAVVFFTRRIAGFLRR